MTDSPQLETPEQALARSRAWFEDLVENHPDEARVILGRPTGPIGWTEGEERARAFVGMLDAAIDVHCVHRCEHVPGLGIALLRCGVYFCPRDGCRERSLIWSRATMGCAICAGTRRQEGSRSIWSSRMGRLSWQGSARS